MMSNYSPLKVAETFRLLHTLFPLRIDLGIGRGTGADPLTSQALQPYASSDEQRSNDEYQQRVQTLLGFLTDHLAADHAYQGVHALPLGSQTPEVWMLGTSQGSAATAAALGLSFCFGQFLKKELLPQVLEHYRSTFSPSSQLSVAQAMLAVRVLCAESEEEVTRLGKSFWLLSMKFHNQERRETINYQEHAPSLEETMHHPYTESELAFIQEHALRSIMGTPEQVKQKLETLAQYYEVDELLLLTVCPDAQARLRSYQLLAEAFALPTK